MKERFSIRIFALLPRRLISNAYVKGGLPASRFAQWVKILAECNKNVYDASQAIESLYIACMLEQEPPEMLVLEQLTDEEVD